MQKTATNKIEACACKKRDCREWQRASINNKHEVESVGLTGCFMQLVSS